VLAPRLIDAEGRDDAGLADVHPVNQQRHEVERIERRRPPGVELRGGLRDEPAAHGALAGAARAEIGPRRLQAAPVLPRRYADEHLLHDATIQRISVREGSAPPVYRRADPRKADGVGGMNQLGATDRLCETLVSWRLLLAGSSPWLSHRSYSTTSEEPPLSNFNNYRDIPCGEWVDV